jgi:hypothetical protein
MRVGLNSQGRWDGKGQNSPVEKVKVETDVKVGGPGLDGDKC